MSVVAHGFHSSNRLPPPTYCKQRHATTYIQMLINSNDVTQSHSPFYTVGANRRSAPRMLSLLLALPSDYPSGSHSLLPATHGPWKVMPSVFVSFAPPDSKCRISEFRPRASSPLLGRVDPPPQSPLRRGRGAGAACRSSGSSSRASGRRWGWRPASGSASTSPSPGTHGPAWGPAAPPPRGPTLEGSNGQPHPVANPRFRPRSTTPLIPSNRPEKLLSAKWVSRLPTLSKHPF